LISDAGGSRPFFSIAAPALPDAATLALPHLRLLIPGSRGGSQPW